MIHLSGAFTCFPAGQALAPLRKFSAHMKAIQAQNLSEPLECPGTGGEIARLTHTFNGMLARLDQAFTAQQQFSANAAHELRTPLAVMQTNLDVLQKRDQPTAEEYAETVRMASEQTGRLSHLVSTLPEMTELQTIQRTGRVSLSALIEEVLCDLTQVANEKRVTLIQKDGEAELTDSDLLLSRAIYNLVENAIKYNQPSGTVTVGVRMENGMAAISVTDTGIGIPSEQ
ncbi:MAG: histidine kinase dimerization/phospho-acceptor domain-containing protein [Oscillospiraceae bacterium]|nr:histidine kinase dimerization/phospho-acceptor domain-containing protein [Oscillospiraceae bacterium]